MDRPLYFDIWKKLSSYNKMIFIAGPRQAGKTTFAKLLGKNFKNINYFNWDIIENKKKLIEKPNFYEEVDRKDKSKPFIIFDELHKYKDWKKYLKGVYDRDHDNYVFLITGSGRLDLFQKGGDSLAGRYFLFHLWPFTLAELANSRKKHENFFSDPMNMDEAENGLKNTMGIWNDLSRYSGFPDPFLKKEDSFYNIWSSTYRKQVLREDIRDLTALKNTESVELLYSLLPSRIGSPLSMSNLAQDLSISPDTVKSWLSVMERFYMIFRISPWKNKISRSIIKEKKVYLFDYAGIESEGSRFENMVALELLRGVSSWSESGFGEFTLHYLRNRDKEEVDFLIVKNLKPFLLIETKLSDPSPSKNLLKFQLTLGVPAVQLVNKPDINRIIKNGNNEVLITSAALWLSGLP